VLERFTARASFSMTTTSPCSACRKIVPIRHAWPTAAKVREENARFLEDGKQHYKA
jgi:hypothetical protein